VLLVIHGAERVQEVRLPAIDGVSALELLWNSAFDVPAEEIEKWTPGAKTLLSGTSMQLFRCLF
jgi:hypothetical protein